MKPNFLILFMVALLISCNNNYENEELTSLSETLPEIFESFYYSNYCMWAKHELSSFYDTIPFQERDNSSDLIFEKLVEKKCSIDHIAQFDGYLLSLPEVIRQNDWLINIYDTRDIVYFDLTTTKNFASLKSKFIGFNSLSLNEKYKIEPLDLEENYPNENFKFRPEISRVSFNETFTEGFYYITIWKDGGFQKTGTSTLVLIEKSKGNWRIKEIKYYRKR